MPHHALLVPGQRGQKAGQFVPVRADPAHRQGRRAQQLLHDGSLVLRLLDRDGLRTPVVGGRLNPLQHRMESCAVALHAAHMDQAGIRVAAHGHDRGVIRPVPLADREVNADHDRQAGGGWGIHQVFRADQAPAERHEPGLIFLREHQVRQLGAVSLDLLRSQPWVCGRGHLPRLPVSAPRILSALEQLMEVVQALGGRDEPGIALQVGQGRTDRLLPDLTQVPGMRRFVDHDAAILPPTARVGILQRPEIDHAPSDQLHPHFGLVGLADDRLQRALERHPDIEQQLVGGGKEGDRGSIDRTPFGQRKPFHCEQCLAKSPAARSHTKTRPTAQDCLLSGVQRDGRDDDPGHSPPKLRSITTVGRVSVVSRP